MEEIGILPEKYELLDGDVINKMGQGIPHRRAVSYLMKWLLEGWEADRVQTQAPIDVSPEDNPTNEPEPDLAALKRPLGRMSASPGPDSIDLLIEVSDSTLADDLGRKAALYARAGIPEYWVYEVGTRVLHVHRKPSAGAYLERQERSGESEVSPLAKPGHKIRPADILA